MSDPTVRCAAPTLLLIALTGAAAAGGERPREPAAGELPPGVSIERARPEGEAAAARARLMSWRGLYQGRLAALRRAAGTLFEELETSSLAALTYRCRGLAEVAGKLDRRGLFASGDVELDRVLFGAIERFRVGSAECVGGRYLNAYRLLVEARMGLEWIDRRIEHRLRPRVPLAGLDPPR